MPGSRNVVSDSLSRAVRWAEKQNVDKENTELEYEFAKGVKSVFARNVTAKENSEAFLWKDHGRGHRRGRKIFGIQESG